MQFTWFDVVLCIALANAVVFAVAKVARPVRTRPDGWLAGLLLVLAAVVAKMLLHSLGWWQQPAWRYFPLGIDLWPAALLYLYTLALTRTGQPTPGQAIRHLALPALGLLYALVVYVATRPAPNTAAQDALARQLAYGPVKLAEDVLSVVLGLAYGWLAYRQLRRYQHSVHTYLSNSAVPTHAWLRNLLACTAVVLLLLGAMVVTQQASQAPFLPLAIFYSYLCLLIYVLGFFGFRHQRFQLSAEMMAKKEAQLADTGWQQLLARLTQWMETEKPYLQPELNLNQCAACLGCSTASLSEAISHSPHKNFRDLVNQYRVEDYKQRLATANLKQETLLGLAYDCGFNSEASFYRIFKEKTGLTPKAFLKRMDAGS